MRDQLPQDPSLLALRPLPVVAVVPPQAVEYLLTCCIADPVLFRDTQRLLQNHHFNLVERPLAITWDILCDAAANSWVVTFELLQCQLVARAGMDYGLLTPDQMEMMLQPDPDGLFWSLTHPFTPITPHLTRYARSVLQQFLQERTIAAPLQRLAALSQGSGCVGDMTQMLAAAQAQQAKLTSLQAIPVVASTIARGTAQKQALQFLPTGLRFVDEAVGGDCSGDVNGLLGPTGGGKTTLALHMAVSSAKLSNSQAKRDGQKPPLVVYATYEQAAEARLRPMAWSVAYQIPRNKLLSIGNDWNQLTTKDNLEPYERSLLGADPSYPGGQLSETERWDYESTWLGESFTFLDMSGCEEHPTAGNDGLAELVSYLDRLQSDRGQPIRSVYIDYAGLLISGAATSQGIKDESAKRAMLKDLGMECRRRISQHFNCTTWVLHQMAGAAGKTSPTKLLTHNDAADCKSFAENMAVCGCLGTDDKQTGCRWLNWSKTRYNSSQVSPPSTLRIHDRFALMEDVSAVFTPDTARGVFMTAEDSRRIDGAAAAPRRQAGPRGLTVGNGPDYTQADRSTL